MPGMEGAWHRFRFQNSDRRREGSVKGALQVFCRDMGLQNKACYLSKRMDAGVGAS